MFYFCWEAKKILSLQVVQITTFAELVIAAGWAHIMAIIGVTTRAGVLFAIIINANQQLGLAGPVLFRAVVAHNTVVIRIPIVGVIVEVEEIIAVIPNHVVMAYRLTAPHGVLVRVSAQEPKHVRVMTRDVALLFPKLNYAPHLDRYVICIFKGSDFLELK